MIKNKIIAVFFAFVLLVPVVVAISGLVLDSLENVEGKTNCFNIQEEEEEGHEEADDNETASKIIFSTESKSEFINSRFNLILTKVFLKNTFYLPGVPSPPPELS